MESTDVISRVLLLVDELWLSLKHPFHDIITTNNRNTSLNY